MFDRVLIDDTNRHAGHRLRFHLKGMDNSRDSWMTALEIRSMPGRKGRLARANLLRSEIWCAERASDSYYTFFTTSGWGHCLRGFDAGPDDITLWCPLPVELSNIL